ncbi:hypothetical protein [Lysobacter enzymogenes]|uniref:hypothetical protein n=1 Tax=Lysobacter enzymogenes TaxID=69 RepID=UPI001A9741FF|nr:hypothetical protein [Lysobacter enzymogenes]QQP94896.1 hypothetical protein JHW38_16790 [Lysobacter enzymogenes]
MMKILAIVAALISTGLGISAILTRSISLHWTIGNGEPRLDEPPTEVRGWPAVVLGVVCIGIGAFIVAKHVL